MGDVVRDLPLALQAQGWGSTILTPSYGMFHKLPGAVQLDSVDVHFSGKDESVEVYEVPGNADGVRNIAFEHRAFSPHGAGQVYSEDGASRPFATDAAKFALLGATAAAFVEQLKNQPDVVHLHDWHAAFYLLMREYAPHYDSLRDIRTVFTIHNLSYQGLRPLRGDESALEAWFPGLEYLPDEVGDPENDDCINPMAMAIRLADRISTVSPTYAGEICRPSNEERGFIGGEGLEGLLVDARDDGRLVGILNGCYYNGPKGRRPGWQRILGLAAEQLESWPTDEAHSVAGETLAALPKRRPRHVLTSVGRLVRQKASLFFENLPDGRTALEAILDDLGSSGVVNCPTGARRVRQTDHGFGLARVLRPACCQACSYKSSIVCRADFDQLNRADAARMQIFCQAASAAFLSRNAFATEATKFCACCCGEPPSNTNPVRPSTTVSFNPPVACTTHGCVARMASIWLMPQGSKLDGIRNRSPARYSGSASVSE